MTINRYLTGNILKGFFAALGVLYGVMLIVEWIKVGRLVSLKDADVLLLAMVPMAVFIIPMALLFSVLMVLEKLSSESEIVAMTACGVKNRVLYAPIVIFSLVCCLVQLSIATYLGPLSIKRIQGVLLKGAHEKIYAFIQEQVFDDTFKDMVFYVDAVDTVNQELLGVFLETKDHWVITAQKGALAIDAGEVIMRLKSGSMFMRDEELVRYITFDDYLFSLQTDLGRDLDIGTYEGATQAEFHDMIKTWPNPRWIKEYHNRLSFPLLNLLLGLIGITFGVQRPRSPRFTGFVMGVGTIFGYYLVFVFADRLVKGLLLNPLLGAWLPNLVFFAALSAVWIWRALGRTRGGA